LNEDPLVASEPLTFQVREGPGYAVVAVAGEIDAGTESRFRDALTSVLSRGVLRLVVDLSGVPFMASAGIGVLMGVRRVLMDSDGQLALASPHGEVAQVLKLTGVSEVIPVAPSVPAAVSALSALPVSGG
jgi:anti-sigma B factor antagonist